MDALLEVRDLRVRFGAVEAVRGGEVVETGECERVLTAPEHAYTHTLLAAVPTLRTNRERPLAMAGA